MWIGGFYLAYADTLNLDHPEWWTQLAIDDRDWRITDTRTGAMRVTGAGVPGSWCYGNVCYPAFVLAAVNGWEEATDGAYGLEDCEMGTRVARVAPCRWADERVTLYKCYDREGPWAKASMKGNYDPVPGSTFWCYHFDGQLHLFTRNWWPVHLLDGWGFVLSGVDPEKGPYRTWRADWAPEQRTRYRSFNDFDVLDATALTRLPSRKWDWWSGDPL